MRLFIVVGSMCLAWVWSPTISAQTRSTNPQSAGSYTLGHCLVTLLEDAQVPAREPGVLESIEIREGFRVKAGQLLAQIEDDKVQKQKALAELELRVAKLQSENDVDTRFAEKSAQVAQMDYLEAKDAIARVANALSKFELRRRDFSRERAVLQTEQASRDHKVAEVQEAIAQAKLDMADNEIDRRRVVAPFAGVVAETYPNAGEWVNPGDPILRLLRMDRLQVEGFVNANDFAPNEVFGQPVTIEVKLARDHVERFNGTIGFVSPDVEASGEFRVWAEIDNRTTGQGHYLVRPGMTATMILNIRNATSNVSQRR